MKDTIDLSGKTQKKGFNFYLFQESQYINIRYKLDLIRIAQR